MPSPPAVAFEVATGGGRDTARHAVPLRPRDDAGPVDPRRRRRLPNRGGPAHRARLPRLPHAVAVAVEDEAARAEPGRAAAAAVGAPAAAVQPQPVEEGLPHVLRGGRRGRRQRALPQAARRPGRRRQSRRKPSLSRDRSCSSKGRITSARGEKMHACFLIVNGDAERNSTWHGTMLALMSMTAPSQQGRRALLGRKARSMTKDEVENKALKVRKFGGLIKLQESCCCTMPGSDARRFTAKPQLHDRRTLQLSCRP